MKLSVIIPVYNVEKYIVECLDSVVKQSVDNVEVICVNDGSTDNSLEVLQEYEKKYNFIYVYSKKNGGLSSARNYGIEKATGDYIFFLDSDDLLADCNCFSFIKKILKKEKVDILYFDGCCFFEEGLENKGNNRERYSNAYRRKESYGFYQKGKFLFADFVQKGEYYCQVSLQCISKVFLVENKIFFSTGLLYEDNLFTFKAILLANHVIHQKRTVLLRRIRSGSIIQSDPSFHDFYSLFLAYKGMMEFWENQTALIEINKEVEFIVNSVGESAKNIYYKLDKGEQEKLFGLSEYEQYFIKKTLLYENTINIEGYIFPYYLFPCDSRVAIYGAGNIGKKFYYIAIREKIIDIVGIFDSNALEKSADKMDVFPRCMIKEVEFDYILIAVENMKVAQEIKEDLLSMGIEDYRIKWDGSVYLKNNFYLKSYEYYKFSNRLMCSEKSRLILVMLPEHGNLGDHAIAIAEEKFLRQYFQEYELICITTNEFYLLHDYLIKYIQPSDILFFQGGGYIGDLWGNGKTFKKIINLFPDNIKIILPNSLAYEEDYQVNSSLALKELRELYSDKKLYIFFRDIHSFQFYIQNGFVKRCYYFPDMAMFLSNTFQNNINHNLCKKVLLCLRNDKEKIFHEERKIKQILKILGLEYFEADTHLYRKVPKHEEMKYISELVKTFQSSRLIITDRLHGMVLAVICGIPCVVFDNSTHKISSVFEWIKERPNVALCRENDMEKMQKIIELVLKVGYIKYKPMTKEFNEMAEVIKSIISK